MAYLDNISDNVRMPILVSTVELLPRRWQVQPRSSGPKFRYDGLTRQARSPSGHALHEASRCVWMCAPPKCLCEPDSKLLSFLLDIEAIELFNMWQIRS